MLESNSIKVLMVMRVGVRHKCWHAGNMMQNNDNLDNANGDACSTNQTFIFIRIKYLYITFCYQL